MIKMNVEKFQTNLMTIEEDKLFYVANNKWMGTFSYTISIITLW